MDPAAFQAYAITSSLLAAELIILAFMTGGARSKSKKYVNPEDAKTFKGDVADRDSPETIRAQRMHMNLLENAVPFFVVGALYVVTGASKTGAYGYFGTFLVARLLHPIFYMKAIQPFRTLMFAIGALAILGMAFHVIRSVI